MDVIFCMQGILELSHTQTPFGGFSHEMGSPISHLPFPDPLHIWHHWGQALPASPAPPHLSFHCRYTPSTQSPSRHITHAHAVSSDLALIAKVWTENGRCEKIKCRSLTFTEGQLGLVPDLEIIYQWLHRAGREQKRLQRNVSSSSEHIWALVYPRAPDGCAALTWHHQDNSSLCSLRFQSIRFLCRFKGLFSSWSCQRCQPLRDCGSYCTCVVTVCPLQCENHSVTLFWLKTL